MGDFEDDLLAEGRGEDVLFSLESGSEVFFCEDLEKKPFMDDDGAG